MATVRKLLVRHLRVDREAKLLIAKLGWIGFFPAPLGDTF
jgi:hypothetical protein